MLWSLVDSTIVIFFHLVSLNQAYSKSSPWVKYDTHFSPALLSLAAVLHPFPALSVILLNRQVWDNNPDQHLLGIYVKGGYIKHKIYSKSPPRAHEFEASSRHQREVLVLSYTAGVCSFSSFLLRPCYSCFAGFICFFWWLDLVWQP